MNIVIARDGSKGEAIACSVPENEAKLQKFLEDNLDSLPWAELEPDLDLFQLGREFRTRSGRGERTDLLAIDAAGNFYIVETKLGRNADKRTVIAQALDYGASIWSSYPNVRDLTDALDAKYSFKKNVQSHFEIEDKAIVELIERFEENVREARFRFVVVMDEVDEALKDLIRFINPNSNFKVYVVDLKFFKHQEIEVVVPTMYGVEAAKLGGAPSRTPKKGALTLEEFKSRSPDKFSAEDRSLIAQLAHVTVYDTAHRPTLIAFFGQTKGAEPVELYYLDPGGQIRLRHPGPASSAHDRPVHERWKAALTQAGLAVPEDEVDRGKGWSRCFEDWRPHAEKLFAAISRIASE